MHAGNGKFKWYWSLGEDPGKIEYFTHGPFKTREEVIKDALQWCAHGDKAVIARADNARPNHAVFDEERLEELILEHNEEIQDEEGELVGPPPAAWTTLKERLHDVIDQWITENDLRSRMFGSATYEVITVEDLGR